MMKPSIRSAEIWPSRPFEERDSVNLDGLLERVLAKAASDELKARVVHGIVARWDRRALPVLRKLSGTPSAQDRELFDAAIAQLTDPSECALSHVSSPDSHPIPTGVGWTCRYECAVGTRTTLFVEGKWRVCPSTTANPNYDSDAGTVTIHDPNSDAVR